MPYLSHFSINKFAHFAFGATAFFVLLWIICGLNPSDLTSNKPDFDEDGHIDGFLGSSNKTNSDTTNAVTLDEFKHVFNANKEKKRPDSHDYAPEPEAKYMYAIDATTWHNHLYSLMFFFGMCLLVQLAFDVRARLNNISVEVDFRLYMFVVSEPITALTTQTVLWYLEHEAGMLMDNNISIFFGMYLPFKSYARALCHASVTLMPLIKRTVGFSMMRATQFDDAIPQREPVRPLCAVRGQSQAGYCLRGVFCLIGVAILVALSLHKGVSSNEHALKNHRAMHNQNFNPCVGPIDNCSFEPSAEHSDYRRKWLNEKAGANQKFIGSLKGSWTLGNTTIARGVELTADNSISQIRMLLAEPELTWKVCDPVTDKSLKKYCENYMSNKFPQESGIKDHLSMCNKVGDPELIKIKLSTRSLLEEVMNDRDPTVKQQNLKQASKISNKAATVYKLFDSVQLFLGDVFVTVTVFGHCKVCDHHDACKIVSTEALKPVVGVGGIVTNVFQYVESNIYKTMFYSVLLLFVNFYVINSIKVNRECVHMTMSSEKILEDVLSCTICAVAQLLIFNAIMFYRFWMTGTPVEWQFYCANAVTLSLFGYSMYKKYILYCKWLEDQREAHRGAVAERNFYYILDWLTGRAAPAAAAAEAPAAPAAPAAAEAPAAAAPAEHNWCDWLFSPITGLSTLLGGIWYFLTSAGTSVIQVAAPAAAAPAAAAAGAATAQAGAANNLILSETIGHIMDKMMLLCLMGADSDFCKSAPKLFIMLAVAVAVCFAICGLIVMIKKAWRY